MVPHLAAAIAASAVGYLLHLVVGGWVSMPVEFLIGLPITGVAYVYVVYKLRRWHDGY